MSRVRGRDTRPEILLRKALWRAGYRYRLRSDLPGRPDLVFPGARLAVFVDGCFWHGCPTHYSAPSTHRAFWAAKLRYNVEHDLDVDDALRDLGWRSFHIWQHELRDVEEVIGRFAEFLHPRSLYDNEDLSGAVLIAQHEASYDAPPASPWYRCPCGSEDVRVLEVAEPGSLRPRAEKRPRWVRLVCTRCRGVFQREPHDL
jgi:DNA mismatch endonuclease (patch repair protein)